MVEPCELLPDKARHRRTLTFKWTAESRKIQSNRRLAGVRAWGSGNVYVTGDDKILWTFQWIVETVKQYMNTLKANNVLLIKLILNMAKREPDTPWWGC